MFVLANLGKLCVYRPVQMSQNQNFFGRSQSQTRLGERSDGGKVQKISVTQGQIMRDTQQGHLNSPNFHLAMFLIVVSRPLTEILAHLTSDVSCLKMLPVLSSKFFGCCNLPPFWWYLSYFTPKVDQKPIQLTTPTSPAAREALTSAAKGAPLSMDFWYHKEAK